MKRTVRNGVFETNSSSVHVIAISKEKPKTLPSVIYFGHGEFGWENCVYSESYMKAKYFNEAIHAALSTWGSEKENRENIKAAQDKVVADFAERGIEAIFEPDKYSSYKDLGEKYYDGGYIDHGNELKHWVKEMLANPDKLIDFLFSDDSYLETGNDNNDYVPKRPDENKFDSYLKWN